MYIFSFLNPGILICLQQFTRISYRVFKNLFDAAILFENLFAWLPFKLKKVPSKVWIILSFYFKLFLKLIFENPRLNNASLKSYNVNLLSLRRSTYFLKIFSLFS